MARRTGNPPVRDWLNGGSIEISKEAKAVNQQTAERCDSSLQTATDSLVYRLIRQHIMAPYKGLLLGDVAPCLSRTVTEVVNIQPLNLHSIISPNST